MRSTAALVLLLLTFTAAPGIAQIVPATGIAGVVTDSSGGALVGATVVYTNGAAEQTTVTDANGRFAFEVVPPGQGTVTAAFPHFQAASQPARRGGTLALVLLPDVVSETVEVNGVRPATRRVVSATRTDTLLRDVPQAVSVVTQELIADQRMQSMADVVRYMPGVGMAQGEGHRDAPVLRGNTTTSDFFVDGVRDDVQYFRDVYNVERVEALKGPNAMIFGRGGVGGVINRVSRQADWSSPREVGLQFGSWGDRRFTTDLGTALNDSAAARVTAMYHAADSFRQGVTSERVGVNPTVAFQLSKQTTLRAAYEFFQDERTVDRGVSSFNGRPLDVARSTFFGDPSLSTASARVHLTSALLEHRFTNGLTIRNRSSFAAYDKFYQNSFPGAVNAAGTSVSLSAYNNDTQRTNAFNQTDALFALRTGPIGHALLAGTEFGRQSTDNIRLTGYFTTLGPAVTSVSRPVGDPRTTLPMEFRPSATDANNSGVATVAAAYVQDQVTLTRHLQAVVGVRVDRFQVDFRNNRTAESLVSTDLLVSPRAGVIVKPVQTVSIYGNVSLAYLPRAGEQLASLSLSNRTLDPERFTNYEVGAKWDLAASLALTAALYRLDRDNVAVPDPLDPTRSLLVDAQRTNGLELEVSGRVTARWSVAGGYAFQDGFLTQTIASNAVAGNTLALLPRHSVSLWNKVALSRRWEAGLGIISRGDSFAAVDNTVVLPGYTRADAGLFYNINRRVRAQLNLENLLDATYFATAHSNTNITPGTPRAVRVALTTRF
jgi:catecholate siderophore receptor